MGDKHYFQQYFSCSVENKFYCWRTTKYLQKSKPEVTDNLYHT